MNYFVVFINCYVILLHLVYSSVVKKDLQKQYLSEPEIVFERVDNKKFTPSEQVNEVIENKSNFKYQSKYLRTEAYNPLIDYNYRRLHESYVSKDENMQSENKELKTQDYSKGDRKYYLIPKEKTKRVEDKESERKVNKYLNKYLRPIIPKYSDSKTEKMYSKTHDSNTENGKKHQIPKETTSKMLKDIHLNMKYKSKYLRPQKSNLKTIKVMKSQQINDKYVKPQISNVKTVKDIQNLSTQETKKLKQHDLLSSNDIKNLEEIEIENLHKVVKKKNDEIIEMLRALVSQHRVVKKNEEADSRRDTVKVLESQSLRDLKAKVDEQEVLKKGERLNKEVEEMKKKAEDVEEMIKKEEEVEEMKKSKKVEKIKKKSEEAKEIEKKSEKVDKIKKKAEEITEMKKQAEEIKEMKKRAEEVEETKKQAEETEDIKKKEEDIKEIKKQAVKVEQEKLREDELSKHQETKTEPKKDLDQFDTIFGVNTDNDTGASTSASEEDLANPLMRASTKSDTSGSDEQLNFNIAGESIYLGVFGS